MSIVALKKKAAAQNKISGISHTGFSLNGGHRSQGYIGQTNLGRSLPRTLMKGAVVKGSGGTCGKYNQTPIVSSAVVSTEDPNIIKSSTLETKGMIATHYRWILRPSPFSVLKTDDNAPDLRSQCQYIRDIKKKSINATIGSGPCSITTKNINTCSFSKANNYNTCKELFTPELAKHIYLDSSDYTEILPKLCNVIIDNTNQIIYYFYINYSNQTQQIAQVNTIGNNDVDISYLNLYKKI